MVVNRYTFSNVFSYYPTGGGVIIPEYNIVINGVSFNRGSAITRSTYIGGLNLFNYIGRDIAAIWYPETKILSIQGFYPYP